MTHVLVNPSYPHGLSQRTMTLPDLAKLEGKLKRSGISPTKFDQIRSLSRQSWTSECEDQDPERSRFRTTYSAYHNRKHLNEATNSRPSSPTRRNNPHPARAFVTLRLRDAPGFEPHREKPGQDPYKVGKRLTEDKIDTNKKLHHSTPSAWNNKTYRQQQLISNTVNSNVVPATEAWLKMASDKDKGIVMDMLKRCHDYDIADKTIDKVAKPEMKASLHRWLRKAGREEEEAVVRLMKTLAVDPYKSGYINTRSLGILDGDRYVLGRYDSEKPVGVRYSSEERVTRRVPYRRDFRLHPEMVP